MPKKQKDGRYRSKIKIGVDENGKDIVKWFAGSTKAELEDERRRVKAYYLEGGDQTVDRLFGPYAMQWYELVKKPVLSEASKRNYRSMMNKHVLPEFGDRHLRAISPQEIQSWMNQFAGKGKSTIDLAATIMRNVIGAAFQDGILTRDPTARLVIPKAAKAKKRRALTAKERTRILTTITRHEHGFYLAVFYYLGLRLGEAVGLQWGDIDWDNSLVHVQRDIDYAAPASGAEGDVKSDESDRYVKIPAQLLDMMRVRRGLPGMYIFHTPSGKPLSKATSERMWIELMLDAGFAVPIERNWKHQDIRARWAPGITPHYLRHNYITMLREAGVDPVTAMRLVGHKDYRTTLHIYTHFDKKNMEGAEDAIERVFGKVAKKLPKNENE